MVVEADYCLRLAIREPSGIHAVRQHVERLGYALYNASGCSDETIKSGYGILFLSVNEKTSI